MKVFMLIFITKQVFLRVHLLSFSSYNEQAII